MHDALRGSLGYLNGRNCDKGKQCHCLSTINYRSHSYQASLALFTLLLNSCWHFSRIRVLEQQNA